MSSRATLSLEPIRLASAAAVGLVASALAAGAIAADAAAEDTYTWSAELVGVDAANRTATVKSRVVHHADLPDLAALSEGDDVTIVWSGLNWASGIRSVTTGSATDAERFTLPAQFVATEMDGQYVTFRVPLPAEDVASIEAMSPGEWVTLTSPHRAAEQAEAVTDIRPYSDAS